MMATLGPLVCIRSPLVGGRHLLGRRYSMAGPIGARGDRYCTSPDGIMKLVTFEAVVRALNEAAVRYVVAGGLAVNAHGYLRLTADIDLVVALDSPNVIRTFAALTTVGYRPLVPVTAQQFADAELRQQWIDQKGMQVLNFFSDMHPETPLDVFVYEPFDFDAEFATALKGEVLPGLEARFVSIPALIAMKQTANRPKDIDDIQHLRWILEEQNESE